MTQPSSSASRPALAIYIHWPFCKSKCPYCDFNSHVREVVDVQRWQTALLRELEFMAQQLDTHYEVTSIFFGGGTPSLMPPPTVAALIERIGTVWPTHPAIEITLEANPTSVEAQRFSDFRAAGVNRVSMGVQSLRPEALAFLGREHSVDEALKAVELAARTFDRYSFDLIYARPNQTMTQWEEELREALRYIDGHLSLYQLTIEQGTAFYHAYHHKGAFALPPDEQGAELFTNTLDILRDAGLPAYEVSNHAKPGQESRHNMSYWMGDPYIGIGPGAHGRIKKAGTWFATQTLKSPERWLENVMQHGHGLEVNEALTTEQRQLEYVLMGLRITQGIDVEAWQLKSLLNPKAIARAIDQKLLLRDNARLKPTQAGWLVLNHLISDLVS